MKKLYTTQKAQVVSDFKNSFSLYRLLFVKALSLAAVVIFLSNISPVSANTQILNNISNNFSGGTNLFKAIPPAYVFGSKLYAASGFAFMGGEEESFKNLRSNIKFQTKAAFDIAFAGREGAKNGVNTFSGVNSVFTNENRQVAEIKVPAVIGEKQNNLSQGNNQHENIDSFPLIRNLTRGLARGDDEERAVTIAANSPLKSINIMNSERQARTIFNLAAGKLSADSTEAVNGSQLYSLGTAVATSFGGSASYEDGKWVAPTFHFKGFNDNGDIIDTSYNDVTSAFTGVGDSFEKVKDQFANIKDEIGKEISTVQSDALLWDETKGAFVAEYGKEGSKTNSKITSLANGAINSSSSDAVAGNQLHALGSSVAKTFGGGAGYENGQWVAPSFILKMFNEDGNEGTSKTYNDVGTAFAGVDTNFSNVNKHLNSVVNEFNEKLDNINKEVKGDSLLWSNEHNAFVATHGDKDSKIKNLAAGDITKSSTDAINGSQLHALGSSVAKSLGGGAGYENGKWVSPKFTVKTFSEDGTEGTKDYGNVSDAFGGVNVAFTNFGTKITNQIKQELGTQISEQIKSDALSWNGEDKAYDAGHGAEGARSNSKIMHLADGTVASGSADAINGSQLHALGSNVAKSLGGGSSYENGKWVAPKFQFKTFNENGDVTDTSYNDVTSAFTGVGDSFEKVKDQFANIKDEIGKEISTVQSDALLWDETKGAFVAEHGKEGSKTNSKITSLANGAINSSSSDAVAGNQLHALGSSVAKTFGGGAGYENGQWVAPSFILKMFNEDGNEGTSKTYNDVGTAFAGVDTNFSNVNKHLNSVVNEFNEKLDNINKEVKGDSLLWSNEHNAFVATHGDKDSKIKNLAAGDITKSSTDAINGSQLHALGSSVAKSLGGGAGYENGKWVSPKFTVKTFSEDGTEGTKDYGNVSDAFGGVNVAFTNFGTKITNQIKQELGTQISEQIKSDALSWNGEDKAYDAGHGAEGARSNSKIMHLADGTVASGSADAINGSQLYALGSNVAQSLGGGSSYENGKWVAPKFQFKTFNENGDVTDTSYNDVTSAFTGVGDSFEKVKDQFANIKDEIGKEISTVQSDALLWDETKGAFVAEHGKEGSKTNSKITSLANGAINSSSSDAVAGNQLHALGSSVAKTFGGGAGYENGQWVAPSFILKMFNEDGNEGTSKTYNDVGTAFAGVDTNFSNVNKHLNSVVNEFNEKLDNINKEVKGDSLLWSNEHNAFVATHGDKDSKIKNLAAGDITKSSTDAINGSQLHALGSSVAKSLGGGAGYENGKWVSPKFTVKTFSEDGTEGTKDYGNVSDAFGGVNVAFTNFGTKITNQIKQELGTQISEQIKSDALSWNGEDKAYDAGHGAEGARSNSKIMHLADGTVASGSADAINGSQLYALGSSVAKSLGGGAGYENGKWVSPKFTVKTFSEDGTEGTKDYGNVSDAFGGVNVAFTNFGTKITNQIKQELGTQISEQIKSDALSWNGEDKAYDAGHGAEGGRSNSKIMHLADGAVASGSADAINGSQLYALGSSVAQSLGGGSSYENGKWVAPKFQFKTFNENGDVTDTSYNDVTSAFTGVGDSFEKVKDQFANIKDEIGKEISTVQSDALLWDETKGAFVAEHGKEGSKTNSKITSLANGAINSSSSDAVAGNQLHALGSSVAKTFGGGAGYENGQWVAPSFILKMFNEDGNEGTSKTYNDVGTAFAGVDTNFSNVNKHLNSVVNEFNEKLDNINKEVKGDSLLWSNEHNAFVATHGDKDSKIKNLAAGDITKSSTDAINGSQLHALGSSVAKSLGGGAGYENGKWVSPKFTVKTFSEDGTEGTKDYGNVSDAFGGVNVAFTNFGTKITNQIKQELGTQISEQIKSDALSWNGEDKAYDAGHGAEGARSNSKIMHLADGTVASGSADAINGSQLHALGSNVAKSLGGGSSYENGKWVAPKFQFKTFNENGDVTDTSYNDVTSAFTGVGDSFEKVKDQFANIKDEIGKEISTVQSDALLWDETKGAFVAEHGKEGSKTNSKITSLANGAINSSSSDAVAGNQLHALGSSVAKTFGGGAGYENGQWVAPSFILKMFNEDGNEGTSKTYNDVGTAFAGVDTNFSNVNKHLNSVVNEFNEKLDNINKEVKGDSLLWSNEHNAFVATHGDKDSKIKNLAAGDITKSSTDAINGSQLHALGSSVAKSLGGGAGYENGKWVSPKFTVKTFSEDGTEGTKDYGNVSDAFGGVNVAFTNFGTKITNQIKQELGTQISEQIKSDALSWNGEDKAYDAGHGAEGARSNSKIMHLADGTVASGSADAINGSQLHALGSNVAKSLGGGSSYENGKWVAPKFQFKTFNENGDVTDTSYNDVTSAFTGVGDSFEKVKDQFANIKDEIGKEISTVQSDALLWDETKGAFVAEHGKEGSKTNSKITSLANGAINSSSSDAVAGNQLHALGSSVAKTFGGGAGYENGQWVAPSFILKMFNEDGNEGTSKTYNDVGTAFAGVDTNFSNVNKHLNSVVNEFNEKLDNINKEVKGDSLLWSNEHNAFVATHGDKDSKIKNLAAGDITKSSTDAINGSQLHALGSSVAKSLGGGAGYENGKWVSPKFTVKTFSEDGTEGTKDYGNVSDAFGGVNVAFTNFGTKITNQIKQELGTQISEQIKSDALSWNGEDKAYDAGHGAEGARSNSKIMHLADGTVASGSADAINGSQLYALGSNVAQSLGGGSSYENGKWVAPKFQFKTFNENGDVTDTSYNDVTSAFTGVGDSFEKVKDQFANIKDEIGKEISTVQSDALLWDETKGAFVAEHGKEGSKTNSKITSLANGAINSSSSDAVAGNQLHALGSSVAKTFGGGAGYENGQWVAPSFILKMFNEDGNEGTSKTYNDVGTAFAGVDTNFSNVNKHLNSVVNEFNEKLDNINKEVKGDSLLWSNEHNAFVATHGDKDSKIKNLAAGDITKSSTDAINGSQLHALGSSVAKSLGGGAGYDKEGNLKAPSFKVKTVKDNGESEEQEYKNVAEALTGVGSSFTNIKNEITNQINHLQSDDSAVVHYDKKEKDEIDYTSVTLGKGKNSTAVGLHNVADGQIANGSHDAVTGGQINRISQDVAKFLGGDTSFEKGVFTGPSYKLSSVDTYGQVKSTEFTDVGSAFTGLDKNIKNVNDRIKEVSEGVAQDSLSWSKDDNAFSAQHGEGKERTASKITHILDGNVTKGSTDAVNGSQLYSMNNTLASYLGGGAAYKEGNWVAPSFKVNTVNTAGDKVEEKSYDNVAAAFEGVGSSFTNLHNEVTNAVTNINNHINNVVSDSLVKQDAESKVIKIGAEKGGTSINIANSGDAARTLTGVKAGSLTEASTDAVNGSQLYSMNNTLASYLGGGAEYKEGNWVAPSFKVHTVSSDGSKVEEQSYKTVAEAFAGVGSSFTNIHKELKNEINQVVGDSLVKQDEKTHVIAVGGEKSGTEVTFANTDGASRSLTGVKAGSLTETSTEAVNGSQLFATNQNVTTVRNDLKTVSENTSKYLGGGADVLKGVAPTYTVQDKSYQSVAEAFGGVDRSFTQLHEEISKNTNEVSENIKQNALLWSESEKAFSAQHGEGKDRTSSKITSLANGDITANSTDAVNGSQLYSMNQTLASYFGGGAKFENGQWIAPSFKVNTVSEDGSKVEEKSYDDVAKAFASVGTSFSNLHNEMTNAVTNINNQISQVVSDSLVKQDATTNLINIGKEVAGTEINIANKDSEDRTLSGVKAAVNDNEAVNKAQLDQSLEQLSNSLQSDDSAVVLYDKKENGETDYTSVTLGKGSNAAPVALHNVADGQIAENSHDAVTGGQINRISQDVAKFLGGETSFKDGTFTGPTYKLSQVDEKGEAKQAEFKDVGSAFTGLDTNIKNVNNHLTNVVQDFTQQITDITEEVKGDALLWSEDKEAFVATHGTDAEKKNSKITSLANGDITANSTDAINGSQLYSMNNTLATYFGGGAKFENGQWISPSFKVNTVSEDGSKVEEKSYDNVAKAFASVGTSFTNLHNELKNEISQVVSDSLVKQDEESKVIKIGAEKEGTEITIANSDGAVRSLSGVKAGTLSADSTEAVNGSQLYSMNNTLASYFGGGAKFENGQWIAPSFKILSFNDDGSSEETSYNNVAAAFAGVNQSFTKLHHELSETVEQNALLWSDADESFVALHGKGSEKHNSKLSHLVDGDISAGSTEAITGNQLYQLNQTLAAYLGGGASYQGGQWTAPQFQITQFKSDGSSSESKSYDNVAGAFEGVNGSLSGINDRINNVAQNVSSNSLNWNDDLGGYDGRHDGKDSKITHVADGDVSEGSKEVVNGGQLWKTEQKVSAVEQRVDGIDKQVQDIALATDGSVKYDKDEAGNKTNKITLVGGNESDPVLIDNVAEGRIESGSKEAINGGQLHDYTEQQMKLVLEDAKKYTDEHITDIVNNGVSESKAYTDMKFETLNYAVEDVRKEARQAAAIGLAVSNLRYYDIPGSVSVSFGSGLWRSQSAFAIGAGYTSEDGNIRSNVSITSAGGHWGIGAGITLRLR